MARKIFTYADFSGGDYGRLENWRAPKNTFSATNMLVYRTGELGVRPGVRNVTPSGVANGTVKVFGRMPGTVSQVFFNSGTALKTFTATEGGTLTSITGALSDSPLLRFHQDDAGNTTYIATQGMTTNGYSLSGTTLTALTNMPGAQAVALYGDRLAIVPSSATNTVVFSAGANYNDWTIAADHAVSITVGDTDPIMALVAQRTHLVILKENGGIYILTGTPGTNESLRPVARVDGPVTSWAAARVRADDRIWYCPTGAQQPSVFDGANVSLQDNYPLPLIPSLSDRAVFSLRLDDLSGAAFVVEPNDTLGTDNEVWVRYRGAWTKHTFGVDITSQVASVGGPFAQNGDTEGALVRYGSMLVFTDGGGASAPPTFWSWIPFMDRPGLEADPFSESTERAGDDSDVPVSGSALLAEQRADDGTEIQVRGVIVDFRSWDTGGSENNHFDLTVNTLNSYESASPVASATASFDEDPGQSSLAGSVRSKYFSFGDQGRGTAFNLELTNVRGVAFQRFRIVTETYPMRGF